MNTHESRLAKRALRHAVNANIGGRLRELRQLRGVSQGGVGRHLGLTFSQLQKYENGSNRIGAGDLVCISEALNIPIDLFFDPVGSPVPASIIGVSIGARRIRLPGNGRA